MCRHEFCPIKEGKCISEKPGWEWAEKFGLPEANPTQRQFLIEQSARWNEIVVHEGENRPNPVSGSACDESKVVDEVPVETAVSTSGCGCGGKSYPSLLTQAGNLARSIKKHVANGMAAATKEEQQRRLAICGSCPLLNAAAGRCLECGCVVSIKTSWASEACPLGKWGGTEKN